ncbi:MAG: outer membrane lipid asymmetry maintenance protein MlaD [Mangrovicoccus sp.]|nr:outer membrane lipid asymmetry maintenance protein MlaD [Mangrovicoccus sp.]
MAQNRTELAVGAAVLLLAGGFLAYTMGAVGSNPARSGYELNARFRSVDGVRVGTDVRLAGVKIGTVASIDLDPQSFQADTILNLREDVILPDDSSAVITTEGLLGGTYVEIQPGGSPFNYEPGADIFETQGTINVISLLAKFVSGGE